MKPSASILFLLLATSCADAPRDNLLDPLSPNYQGDGAVTGSVLLKNIASRIPGAQIRSLEEGLAVMSDSAGAFIFRRLSLGTQTLVCSKDYCVPDTQRIVLTSGSSQSVTFVLNGTPRVLSQQILTRKVDQYYPSPQYYVDVSADITDPNGITDIDSVWFKVDSLQFPMDYLPSTKLFHTTIFKYDIPTNTIQWLVGRPLYIVSRDLSQAVNISDPFFVTRVIEYGATPVSPSSQNNDTTNGTPLLKWLPPSVTFNYTYTLTISRIDGGTPTIVWIHPDVNSYYEEWTFPSDGSGQVLVPGDYVWAVTVVDEFGNSCRSKESFFVVR
jgi:hypothetical protein